MPYVIKARYYSGPDQTRETYVITSDNANKDTRHEVGTKMMIIPMGVVEEAKKEAVKEVKDEVAKVFDDNPSEKSDEDKSVIVAPVAAIQEVHEFNYVVPVNCSQCSINRSCPMHVAYMSSECRSDLSAYYTQQEKKKNKP